MSTREELLTYSQASRYIPIQSSTAKFYRQLSNQNNYHRFGRHLLTFVKPSNDLAKKCFINILKEIYLKSNENHDISRYDTIPQENLAIVFMNGSHTQTITVNELTTVNLGDRSKSFLYDQYEPLKDLTGIIIGTFYFTNAIVIVRTNDADESLRLLQCYLQIDKNVASGKKSKRKKRVKKSRSKK